MHKHFLTHNFSKFPLENNLSVQRGRNSFHSLVGWVECPFIPASDVHWCAWTPFLYYNRWNSFVKLQYHGHIPHIHLNRLRTTKCFSILRNTIWMHSPNFLIPILNVCKVNLLETFYYTKWRMIGWDDVNNMKKQ